jgi:predicted RNA-binding protein with TRAM domain
VKYNMQGRGFKNPPVQVGEELDVKIEAVGEKGDGIAKKDGFVLFVPGVKEGDEVRIRVTKVLRNVGFAESVGEASASVGSEEPEQDAGEQDEAEESSEEESEKPAEEESGEDSEDFGEDSEEGKD